MVQMDGSPHNWFDKGEEYCLMHMVDDSTNIAFGLFDTGETTDIALRTLYGWIEKYGIPQSLYVGRGIIFYTDRKPTQYRNNSKELFQGQDLSWYVRIWVLK